MGLYSHVFPTSTATHIPSGISTEMLSTPLLTVRGLVCSEGEDAHSSCNPIGWYCIISWERGREMEEKMLSRSTKLNNYMFKKAFVVYLITGY